MAQQPVHRPVKFGFLFSAKACNPSTKFIVMPLNAGSFQKQTHKPGSIGFFRPTKKFLWETLTW